MKDFPSRPNYKIIEKLGQGSFGSAYKVKNEENEDIFVIKKILLEGAKGNQLKEIKNEAQVLSSINSENIVKYFESFEDKESFNIVMEYCDRLDLGKYIKGHKICKKSVEKQVIYHIILEICNGLKEIHNKKLIHRDLKPDNIFLTSDSKIKIGDFGLAKQLNQKNQYAKTQAGTILYMAPEIINGVKYNNKVDIWALGCIIHELCTLNVCFEGESINEVINKIIGCKHEKIDQKVYGADMQNLIDLLLKIDYKKRPDIDEVIKMVKKYLGNSNSERLIEILNEDEVYEKFIIEKNIEDSINQVNLTILSRELKYSKIKLYAGAALICIPLGILLGAFTGGISFIAAPLLGGSLSVILSKIIGGKEKLEFIVNNSIITTNIQNKLIDIINKQLDKNILKEKIIIYNKENFDNKIQKIKSKLLEKKYILKLQNVVTSRFNIQIVGCTNA